jgi:hypothetical protein
MEESGWKLVHGDVFRPPRYPKLFAAVIGSGIQIFCMAVVILCKILKIILKSFFLFLKKKIQKQQFHFDSFCHARHALSGVSWSFDDSCDFLVRFHGVDSWISLWTSL